METKKIDLQSFVTTLVKLTEKGNAAEWNDRIRQRVYQAIEATDYDEAASNIAKNHLIYEINWNQAPTFLCFCLGQALITGGHYTTLLLLLAAE